MKTTIKIADLNSSVIAAQAKLDGITEVTHRGPLMRATKSIAKTSRGWEATVWFGHADNPTNVMRYVYQTRAQARSSDISDSIGRHGRIA